MALFSSKFGHEGTLSEFEWLDGELGREKFQLIKEGYLYMSFGVEEDSERKDETGYAAARSLRRNSSFSKGWKKRWFVLSQTGNGTNLFYYKQRSSFNNCEAPCGVLLMEDCQKLYTMPSHPKSKNTFAIEFPYKTVLLYTEKESELNYWLEVFQKALKLTGSEHRQLKGLPKQKAIRRETSRSLDQEEGSDLALASPLVPSSPRTSSAGSHLHKGIPFSPPTDAELSLNSVKVVSIKNLST